MAFLEVKFFFKKKNHLSEGPFFKNDQMCNSYESRSVSARAESYKKVRKQKKKFFFYLHVFWDPGWEKIWIRDKHPGSATLPISGVKITALIVFRFSICIVL
jgi:hypothetical protein